MPERREPDEWLGATRKCLSIFEERPVAQQARDARRTVGGIPGQRSGRAPFRVWAALLALVAISCGDGQVDRFLRPIAGTVSDEDRGRVASALRTLERLHESGGLAHLRSGVCGAGPGVCRTPGSTLPRADEGDIIGSLTGAHRRECPERCIEQWEQLESVQQTRRELSRNSRAPNILEPFRRAVRRLSPDPGEDACDAAPDSMIRAQAAVLAHVFELDPVPLRPIYSEAPEDQLTCLRVPTLFGHVPVEADANASLEAAGHGNAIHQIGEPLFGGDEPPPGSVPWAERTTVVELSFWCGPHCGGGDAYLVAYASGEWRVVSGWHAWDS